MRLPTTQVVQFHFYYYGQLHEQKYDGLTSWMHSEKERNKGKIEVPL